MTDTKPCQHCGATMVRLSVYGASNWQRRRYCDRSCALAARAKHGIGRYRQGCRCDVCTGAQEARLAQMRERNRQAKAAREAELAEVAGTVPPRGKLGAVLKRAWRPDPLLSLPCYESDFDLWTEPTPQTDAKALCRGCPVIADCLTAGRAQADSGVWGGVILRDGRPVRYLRQAATG